MLFNSYSFVMKPFFFSIQKKKWFKLTFLYFIVWNHLLCSYNIEYVYERMYVYHALVIYLCAYILFIHFYCLINQVCVCVCVCIYVFIVACSYARSKSRKRVLARAEHVLYVRLKSIKSIAQPHAHRSNWEREAVSFTYQYQPSMHKAIVEELFYAFNCVRKPWRARMSKNEYECPSLFESNFFFRIHIATRPIRVK